VRANSLDVTGTLDEEDANNILRIGGGSNKATFPVRLDGSIVDINRNLKPGTKWKVKFAEPVFLPTQAVAGGAETVSLAEQPAGGKAPEAVGAESLLVLSTSVPSDSTAEEAALLLYELLVSNGFPDVEIQGAEVSFVLAPFAGGFLPIGSIEDFAFDGSNLLYTLTFPETVPQDTVPEPDTLFLLGTGLFSVVTAPAWRRRRTCRGRWRPIART